MPGLPALAFEEIDYPESDGQPVAETQSHFDELVDEVKQLEIYFGDEPDVWVAGNLFVYFKQGDPTAVAAPDVMVVRGVEKIKRRKYLLWEEGVPPSFVVELTSKSTKHEDTGRKKQKYAQMGVEELFLFDVLAEYLNPRFQGFRLLGGLYRPMRPLADGSLHSRTLGLTLKPEGTQLRLIEASTGKALLRIAEEHDARLTAQRHAAAAERRAREEAERRVEEAERRAAAERRAQEEAERRARAEEKAAEAESRGVATGMATAILALLASREIEVPDAVRSRIFECSDPDRLRVWLLRAATATTAEQVVSEERPA